MYTPTRYKIPGTHDLELGTDTVCTGSVILLMAVLTRPLYGGMSTSVITFFLEDPNQITERDGALYTGVRSHVPARKAVQ